MKKIYKYPRTMHVQGSRLQEGDEDLEAVPFQKLVGHHLIVERKIDGANSGVSFDSEGNLLLQSRGHFLTGGYRERHFNLLKTWANRHIDTLFDILSDQYVMYGEWMYALHNIYYDKLPHYFLEFDIMDTHTGVFLSTEERRRKIGSAPIVSVPIVSEGAISSFEELAALNGPALYKSGDWIDVLRKTATEKGMDPDQILSITDKSSLDEGLYIKDEKDGEVIGRYKFVRKDFVQAICDSKIHWLDRTIIPNQLAPGIDIFSDPI